jgi:sulfur-carrier protein
MSIIVKVPTQLRTLTNGAGEVPAAGDDVGSLIKDLDSRHPGFGDRLLDDSGNLRRFVNIYVNEEDVRFLDGLGTPLPDGAQVSIIPAVAGG